MWRRLMMAFISCAVGFAFIFSAIAANEPVLPGTGLLVDREDWSARMIEGIDRYFSRSLEEAPQARAALWQRDFSSPEGYEKSIQPNRSRLREIIGAVDPRLPVNALEFISSTESPAKVGETDAMEIFAVRWPVFEGVFGEGLWLRPKLNTNAVPLARIVLLPDADQTPEMLAGLAQGLRPELQAARRLAENGCEVLVPALVSRADTFSGNINIDRFTNQPHREWIYRQAYELGRHIIGYEVQKVLAAVDWLHGDFLQSSAPAKTPIGVAGYAEGGLIALYAAALDSRVSAALVSGYFDSRQRLWQEPIYRNVFALLEQFGDAEIASLIAPRHLVIEHSVTPKIDGPPKAKEGRLNVAAPGKIKTPDYASVEKEFERAKSLLQPGGAAFDQLTLISGAEGMATGPFSERALIAFLRGLGMKSRDFKSSGNIPEELRTNFAPALRQERQVSELVDFTQTLFRDSERRRNAYFWQAIQASSPEDWTGTMGQMKVRFHENILGRIDDARLALNPRSRKFAENEQWTGYEVVLDVVPYVFAWGYLLLPKDLKPGEKRPVVVCQHGLEGVPADTINEDENSQAFKAYKTFAARLAERGFIVFAPHNPYRGGDRFRVLQRKANPLGKSLFSVIIAQHDQILTWLSAQPFVDASRIGFYGLSYGGKTAMRVPAVLDGYALSICSADFNEWIHKNVSLDFPASYLYTGEYEMPEFNLGMTFNYAEMAALVAPRPFMVERGHHDAVGRDEWVAYEYAKVRRLYARLGIPGRTEIEFFNGPHTINAQGAFAFLHFHLNWLER